MLIENQWGQKGTGFLVVRAIDDKHGRGFLATNKHVLHRDAQMRQNATHVVLHLNIRNEGESVRGQTLHLPLDLGNGSKIWREHPDRDIDVIAFDITPLLSQYPRIEKRCPDYSFFADGAKLEELDVTIGDDVVVIGHPLGLTHRGTNFPLVRAGMIASRIGESLEDEYEERDGTTRRRVLRGFLIDGATVPGSSGSPVVLRPIAGRLVKNAIVIEPPRPILLGIVAETRYAPIRTPQGEILSYAGLGLAFDAETVKETIELFFQ